MTIRRNKVVLRETEVELPVGAIRLFAQKKGDKITFTIGKTELGFVDIFPLSAANPGVFGVVLSAGVRLDTLEARKQALPRSPSRLENGDTLFSQGKIDKALLEFDRVESTTEAAEVKSEAAYKTGICLVELKRTDEAKQIFEKLAVDTGPWQTRAICQVWKILLKSANPGDQERADLSFDTLHADFDYAELALVLSEEERDQILAYYRQVDHYPRINWTRQRMRNLQRRSISSGSSRPIASRGKERFGGSRTATGSMAASATPSPLSRSCSRPRTSLRTTGSESRAITPR